MIGLKWEGWDGSVWDLQSGEVKATSGGIQGLNSLEAETFTRTTALIDGQKFTGWRAKPRPVLLPVLIGQSATEAQYMDLDGRWWRTMRPDKFGKFIVTAPDGSSRYLSARFENDGEQALDHDPTLDRLSVAAIALIADDPWWKGRPFDTSFAGGAGAQNYYGGDAGDGFGPTYYIAKGSSLDAASVDNPGDVDAWPVYRIDGPATSFSAAVDGFPVAASLNIAADQQLVINTAPDKQIAYLFTGGTLVDGVRVGGTRENVTRLLSAVQFRPIPSGSSARLAISMLGTGRITLAGDPKYFRAWGR